MIDSPTCHPLVRATLKGIRRTIGTEQKMKDPLRTPENPADGRGLSR